MNNPSAQQPTLRPCPDCGGRRVTGKTSEHLELGAELRTDGIFIAGASAVVCTNCGHISLYADDLSELREILQKHPDRFRY